MSFDSLGRLWVHVRDTGSSDESGTANRAIGEYTAVGATKPRRHRQLARQPRATTIDGACQALSVALGSTIG